MSNAAIAGAPCNTSQLAIASASRSSVHRCGGTSFTNNGAAVSTRNVGVDPPAFFNANTGAFTPSADAIAAERSGGAGA